MSRNHNTDRPLRLGGVHEVAELLGIGKSALADRRRHRSFPTPLVELRCGPVWDLDEIEAYREARRRDPFASHRRGRGRWQHYGGWAEARSAPSRRP